MKKYEEFIKDGTLKLKDIIKIPNELKDIYEICKNEIVVSDYDIPISMFYTKIMFDCIMQFNGLTNGHVDAISTVRGALKKSDNELEVKNQYNDLSKPSHEIPAVMLKMLNDYKQINIIDSEDDPIDKMLKITYNLLTGHEFLSHKYTRSIFNLKITVDDI